jgi:hypothetical protein
MTTQALTSKAHASSGTEGVTVVAAALMQCDGIGCRPLTLEPDGVSSKPRVN